MSMSIPHPQKYKKIAKTQPIVIFADTKVEISWNQATRIYYESLGYIFTKYYQKFMIKTDDLLDGSSVGTRVICPLCRNVRKARYNHIKKTKHSYCNSCANVLDITDERFGNLVALRCVETKRGGSSRHALWEFRCDCGNKHISDHRSARSGRTVSCGCYWKELMEGETNPAFSDKSGLVYGRLTVKGYVGPSKNGALWECQCRCGESCTVPSSYLETGDTSSCGCLLAEMKGDKSPNWNPNLTNEERINGRSNPKYAEWRNLVYKRDNYNCQSCKATKSGSIIAHHLYNHKDFPQYRFSLSNGITLCKDCHYDFHINYMGGWAKTCMPEDFHEWRNLTHGDI